MAYINMLRAVFSGCVQTYTYTGITSSNLPNFEPSTISVICICRYCLKWCVTDLLCTCPPFHPICTSVLPVHRVRLFQLPTWSSRLPVKCPTCLCFQPVTLISCSSSFVGCWNGCYRRMQDLVWVLWVGKGSWTELGVWDVVFFGVWYMTAFGLWVNK